MRSIPERIAIWGLRVLAVVLVIYLLTRLVVMLVEPTVIPFGPEGSGG